MIGRRAERLTRSAGPRFVCRGDQKAAAASAQRRLASSSPVRPHDQRRALLRCCVRVATALLCWRACHPSPAANDVRLYREFGESTTTTTAPYSVRPRNRCASAVRLHSAATCISSLPFRPLHHHALPAAILRSIHPQPQWVLLTRHHHLTCSTAKVMRCDPTTSKPPALTIYDIPIPARLDARLT